MTTHRVTTPRPRRRVLGLAVAGVAALVLSGCAVAEPEAEAPVDGPEADLLAEYDLDGMSGREIVQQLDTSPQERPLAFAASVREDEVLISDGAEQEVAVDLPEDEMYVSIAPYVDRTHECYYHSLATCQGELVEEPVAVTITDEDGTVLVEEDATTYTNGFVGYWLPKDISGTIEVEYEDRTGSVPFSTGEGDPTCITTLQVA